MHDALAALGWTSHERDAFQPFQQDHIPGRIALESRDIHLAYSADGERWAEIAGRLRYRGTEREDLPAIGDWVALRPRPGDDSATIDAILPRRTAFVRKQAGFKTSGQVLAANIDLVWIVTSLTHELSARRVERYLTMAWDSGAQPVVVLTKADLNESDPQRVAEVERVSVGAEIVVTSAVTGEGLDVLGAQLCGDRTAALLGSSGVGKSTLVNSLIGEALIRTQETRADDVGRHTTTRRELVRVPTGGLLIDTPGLRELISWDGDGSDSVFADIDALAGDCRFNDCGHRSEPGCAVRTAIAAGDLDVARLRQYEKMQRERDYLSGRKRQRNKEISKAARQRRKLGIDQS